jgi:hypothetical protein
VKRRVELAGQVTLAAQIAIRVLNNGRIGRGDPRIDVRLNHAGVQRIVDVYDHKLTEFKKRHDFGPRERANATKIATLLGEAVLEVGDGTDQTNALFDVDRRYADDPWVLLLGSRTVMLLLSSLTQIDPTRLPPMIARDLLIALRAYDADEEWVALAFNALAHAFGLPNPPGRSATPRVA